MAHHPSEMGTGNRIRLDEAMQIIDTNLKRLDGMSETVDSMREAFLEEKVHAFLSSLSDSDRWELIDGFIREERTPDTFRRYTRRDETAGDAGAVNRLLVTCEQIDICRRIAHAFDRRYHTVQGSDTVTHSVADLVHEDGIREENAEDIPERGENRIAYLRNGYTDRAFQNFSAVLLDAQPTYYSDFPSVCEALQYGRAGACILPLENSKDGKLVRFYELLNQYDFRISMTTGITADGGEVVTEYALLRRHITVPRLGEGEHGIRCECVITPEEGMTLSDILVAVSLYGMTLVRVDAAPLHERDIRAYHVVVEVGGGDLLSYLTYLYLTAPQFTLLGIYRTV